MVWKPQVLDGFSPEASGEDLGRDIITKTGNHQDERLTIQGRQEPGTVCLGDLTTSCDMGDHHYLFREIEYFIVFNT